MLCRLGFSPFSVVVVFWCAIADPSQCEMETAFQGLSGLLSDSSRRLKSLYRVPASFLSTLKVISSSLAIVAKQEHHFTKSSPLLQLTTPMTNFCDVLTYSSILFSQIFPIWQIFNFWVKVTNLIQPTRRPTHYRHTTDAVQTAAVEPGFL